MAPAYEDDGGSPRVGFRGSITRHLPSCLRLAVEVARHHARLASGCWSQLYRAGFAPAGFHQKVSDHRAHPPFPSSLAQLRCLRLAIPSFVPCSSPLARDRAMDQPGVFKPELQPAVTTEMTGSLRFPSNPRVPTPCSWTPVRTDARQAIAACRHGPRLCLQRRLPRHEIFRGSIARHWDSLFTLRSEGRPSTTQNSLPAAGQALPGGIR